MSTMTQTVNTWNKNKFRIMISNIPDFVSGEDYGLDSSVINNNIRGITIPDLTIPMLESLYLHSREIHPNTIGARSLNTFMMSFKVDDQLKSWYYFYRWLIGMRNGETYRKNIKGEKVVKEDCIDSVQIFSYDNTDTVVARMSFNRCFITGVSSLDLRYGTSEAAEFQCTFEYETMGIEVNPTIDIKHGSQQPLGKK